MATPRYEAIQRAAQSPKVRAKLAEVRDQKAQQALALARAEGLDVELTTTEGTRPQGRPYARLSIPASTEFGDSRTARTRLLGRIVQ